MPTQRRPSVRALAALAVLVSQSHCGVHAGWIDPDTSQEHYTKVSEHDGRQYRLVMSDEFNVAGRSFKDGDDPMWTAELHSDDAQTSSGTGSLHFYNHSQVTSHDGYMNITTTSEKTTWRGYNPYKKKYETLYKNFKSGMMNTWNKFCFTGGIIEIQARLPGQYDIGGLWPAFWMLGNLGRATYEASTNLIWPWSYDKCDREMQLAQEISACNGVKHFGMNPHQGRGSTEIDIFEAMPGKPGYVKTPKWDKIGLPYMSGTLQLAPGIKGTNRPTNGERVRPHETWYRGMSYGPNTTQNSHFYGLTVDKTKPMEPVYRSAKQSYKADGVSSITSLAETHFTDFHSYKLEWQPGPQGYLIWYMDDQVLFEIHQDSLSPFGTQIPDEPSYVILNTAVSSSWGFPMPCPPGCPCSCYDCNDPDCACAIFPGFCESLPAHFLVDSVRVYQAVNDSSQYVGCDPPSHPTRLFIKAHPDRYVGLGERLPLKPIRKGGAKCKSDDFCGHGTCGGFWKTCHCEEGFVGPRCLVPHYHDDVTYDHSVDMTPHPIAVPLLLKALAVLVAAAAAIAVLMVGAGKRKQRHAYSIELQKSRMQQQQQQQQH